MVRVQSSNTVRATAALYIAGVYALGVFSTGAWSDDYAAYLDPNATGLHAIKDGRLLYGVLIEFGFSQINNVSGLVFIRLFGLLGLVLLSDLVIQRLMKPDRWAVVTLATVVSFTLPSFQFSAHWAIAFGMSWAAYLSVLGYMYFEKRRSGDYFIGGVLITASILIYPLMSFFVVSFAYCRLITLGGNPRELLRELYRLSIYLVTGMSFAAISTFIFLKVNKLEANPRVALVSLYDFPEKLYWFVSRPMALSFRPLLINSPTVIETLLFCFFSFTLLSLLFFSINQSLKKMFINLTFLFTFLVFSIAPLLLATQNQIDLRFIGANTWLVLFVLIYLFGESLAKFRDVFVLRLFRISVTIFLLIGGFFTINDRFLKVIQPIYSMNQIFIKQSIASCTEQQVAEGLVVTQRTAEWKIKPLLGVFSQTTDFQSDWVPFGAIKIYLSSNEIQTYRILPNDSVEPLTNYCSIDLNKYESLTTRVRE